MDGSIVNKAHRLANFSIYCRRQCLSIGKLPNVLARQECAEVPRLKAIVTDDDYRNIACTIYCGLHWLSIDILFRQVCPEMAIDGHRLPFAILCGGQCLSVDVLLNLLWAAMSIGGCIS